MIATLALIAVTAIPVALVLLYAIQSIARALKSTHTSALKNSGSLVPERVVPSLGSKKIPLVNQNEFSVFIAYRRKNVPHLTGRIYDKLVSQYGSERVFKDLESIPLGVNFDTRLQEALEKVSVFITIVGDNWYDNINISTDYLRKEIEHALQRQIPIIPIFAGKETSFDRTRIPNELKAVALHQGIHVRSDPDFHIDMDRVIQAIDLYTR